MAVKLSALRAGRPLLPGRFLVLISVRGWVDLKAIVRLEGLGKLKNSNDLIGIRTHDLPTCSIVQCESSLKIFYPEVRYSKLNLQFKDVDVDENLFAFSYMHEQVS
jgi:hypothetical protein